MDFAETLFSARRKSKFKPFKDYGAYRVLYFPSILRPQSFLHDNEMVAIPVGILWVVELCIQYCVPDYA